MKAPSGAEGAPSRGYRVPAGPAEAEVRVRGSRFLALAVPVVEEAAAVAALDEIRRRHRGATHHCWAWRLGASGRERSSDDGEPAGTAGEPILRVVRGAGLSDVLVVVVRWFGGTKLGKGGLARAYAGACSEVVAQVKAVRRVETVCLRVTLPYELVGAVRRLSEAPGRRFISGIYGEDAVVVIEVEGPALEAAEEALADLGSRVEVEPLPSSH